MILRTAPLHAGFSFDAPQVQSAYLSTSTQLSLSYYPASTTRATRFTGLCTSSLLPVFEMQQVLFDVIIDTPLRGKPLECVAAGGALIVLTYCFQIHMV